MQNPNTLLYGLCLLLCWGLVGCPKKKDPIRKKDPQIQGQSTEDLYLEALSNHKQGKSGHNQAIKLYRKAISQKPSMIEARFNLGSIYEEQGKYRLAATQFSSILNSKSNHGPSLYRLTQIYVRQKQYERALALFRRLIQANPKYKKSPNALASLASLELENKDYQSAMDNARKLIAINKKDIAAYRLIARINLKQRKYNVVHLIFQMATEKTKKEDAKLYNIKGLAYLGEQKEPEAMASFQEAIKLDPNFFEALLNFGALSLKYEANTQALTTFQKASQLKPAHKTALQGYAIALRKNKKYKQAEKVYTKQILTRYKNDPPSLLNLGIIFARFKKDPKKANTYLRRYLGESNDPQGNKLARQLMKEAKQWQQQQAMMKKMQEESKKQEALQKKKPKKAPAKAPTKAPAKAPAKTPTKTP